MQASDVDDPRNINDFLMMIGREPKPLMERRIMRPTWPSHPVQHPGVGPLIPQHQPLENQLSEANIAALEYQTADTSALASIPASSTAASEASIDLKLNPIQEHELPEIFDKLADPNSTLQDSKYATPPRRLYTKVPLKYATVELSAISQRKRNTGPPVNKLDSPKRERILTTVQQEILDKIAARKAMLAGETPSTKEVKIDKTSSDMSTKLHDEVVAKFKAQVAARELAKENENITSALPTIQESENEFTRKTTAKPIDDKEWLFPEETPSYRIIKAQVPKLMTEVNASTTENTDAIVPVEASIANATKTVAPAKVTFAQNHEIIQHVEPAMTQNTDVEQSVKSTVAPNTDIEHPVKATVAQNTNIDMTLGVKEPGSPEGQPAIILTSSEDPADRVNATHFASWGTPQARATPRAKVRKIFLRGLPASADLTLVQSIIHGGAIDNFALGVNGTAQVTFTTSEACDAYYAKYPNGLTVKYKGKNSVVFVEKAKDVNVVSGMLQGQLDCGASRCVRAVGADHDWGMTALIKLAEGKTRKGKVEHIADIWRSEVRTIAFRFTSIGDAVSFKGMLVRDENWEGCNIQFMDDPCEAAVGVHLE